jgi:hypothetical protein
MQVVYWKCRFIGGKNEFSIRRRSENEAKILREKYGRGLFHAPQKVVIEYSSVYDLVKTLTGAGNEDY